MQEYIYIGKDDSNSGLVKLGRTNNISRRQDEIRNMNPTFSIVLFAEVENSITMERLLHEKFAQKRVVGEWFRLSRIDVMLIVKNITEEMFELIGV